MLFIRDRKKRSEYGRTLRSVATKKSSVRDARDVLILLPFDAIANSNK